MRWEFIAHYILNEDRGNPFNGNRFHFLNNFHCSHYVVRYKDITGAEVIQK